MIDDNLRYSGTIPDERLHDMHRDLRSPMGGGHGGSGGSGPRGAGVFLVDQVFTRSQDDTYQATKSAFLNPLHRASYGVRIGDIVLFYLNTEGILCTGIVTAISGETVTFVKHDEISTVGFSPSIATTEIPGGHRVTVTNEGGSNSFDVMDGVQGPQGEPFEFDDFTPEQLDELRSDVASVYYRKQEATVISFNDVSTIGIPFDNFTFADMLFVDIEGLALTENQDYVINGSTIELTTPITHPNTRINFKLLTIMAITSEDLDTLLEGLADFNGATDSAAGTHGLVPAPAAGDDLDVLFGNGEWGSLNLTTFSWGNDQSISIQANFDNEQAPAALFGSTSLPLASATKAGLMKLEDYSKLQGIQAGAQANVIESISVNGTAVNVNNKNAAISIPQASSDSAGLMAASDKTKLDTISAFSSDNKAALFADGIWWHLFNEMTTNGHLLLKRGRSTGGATPRPIIETIDDMPMLAASEHTPGLMTVSDKTKLDGIEAGANAYILPAATTAALGGVKPDGTTVTVDNDGTIHAASSGVTTVSFPSMFSWEDNPLDGKINRSADGIQVDFDVSELKPEQGKTYYISPSGNDGNTGETPESPLTKLSTALAKNDVQTVVCADGNYNVYRVAGAFTKGVSIVAAENARPRFICSYANPWTLVDGQTNVYQCSAGNATCYGVVDVTEKDTYGDYQPYTLVGSVADVAANAHTYFVDGTTVYANHDTRPNASLYALIGGVPFHATLSNGETIYIEGCDFIGGNSGAVRVANAGSVAPTVLMKDCGFTMGYFANSLYLQGCTSIAQNCYASLAKNDGFNYHAESYVAPKAIEIGCVGRRNGTSGGNTDNGSTIHDGGAIIRINGEYYGNAGPNIADVGEGTQSYNIGVVTHDSAGESTQNNGIQCQDGIMWNDTCAAYNNTDDYYAFHDGTLRQRNCTGTCKVSGTGRVTSY